MTININGIQYNEKDLQDYQDDLIEHKTNTHKDVKKFLNNLAAFILGSILVAVLLVLIMLL